MHTVTHVLLVLKETGVCIKGMEYWSDGMLDAMIVAPVY